MMETGQTTRENRRSSVFTAFHVSVADGSFSIGISKTSRPLEVHIKEHK
jgi:hypothetical protein